MGICCRCVSLPRTNSKVHANSHGSLGVVSPKIHCRRAMLVYILDQSGMGDSCPYNFTPRWPRVPTERGAMQGRFGVSNGLAGSFFEAIIVVISQSMPQLLKLRCRFSGGSVPNRLAHDRLDKCAQNDKSNCVETHTSERGVSLECRNGEHRGSAVSTLGSEPAFAETDRMATTRTMWSSTETFSRLRKKCCDAAIILSTC